MRRGHRPGGTVGCRPGRDARQVAADARRVRVDEGPGPSGGTKLEAAKKSLTAVVDALPDTAQVGLRVYGATVGGSSTSPEACADTQLVAPIGPLDRAGLKAAIAGFDAVGATPIANSVQAGLADLGTTGKRNLILVSDGEETCNPDPCPQIRQVIGSGVDLQVDIVGFAVNPTARTQLQCIAEAGRGSYFDAADASELSISLNKLSQRSLRAFTISGRPVTGAVARESAPVLTPGTYVDTTELNAAKKYYAIDRAPGSTIRFSLTARPIRDAASWDNQNITIELLTPGGRSCQRATILRLETLDHPNAVMTGVARVEGAEPGASPTECQSAARLHASVERTGGTAATVPVQLLVIEEPAVADWSSLPEPTERPAPDLAPATTPVMPVVGGGSFDDATTLTPGTYTETLLPGEQVFYRVRLDFGQQLVATVDAPVPGTSPTPTFLRLRADTYTPDRLDLARWLGEPKVTATLDRANTTALFGNYTPTVLYRNREAKFARPEGRMPFASREAASMAGYHYLSLVATPLPNTDRAVPITVRLRIAVNGTPEGQPSYAGGSAPGSGTETGPRSSATDVVQATGTSDSSGNGPIWAAAAVAVLAVGAGAGTVLALRRRRASPHA